MVSSRRSSRLATAASSFSSSKKPTNKRTHISDSEADSAGETVSLISKPPQKRTRTNGRIEVELKAKSTSTSPADSYANSLDGADADTPATTVSSRSSTASAQPSAKGRGKEKAVPIATSSRRTSTRLVAAKQEILDLQDEDEDVNQEEEEESELSAPEYAEDGSMDEAFEEPTPSAKDKGKGKAKPAVKSARLDKYKGKVLANPNSDDEDPIEDRDDGEDDVSIFTAESDLSDADTSDASDDEYAGSGGFIPEAAPAPAPVLPTPAVPARQGSRAVRTPRGRPPRIRRTREENARFQLLRQHPELETVWAELDKRPKISVEKAKQPEGLSLTMLPFQLEGLHWLRAQEETSFKGGILADEMGMGKTIQTIGLLMLEPRAKPNLVVAPTVALVQWENEIKKHTNNALSVISYHGPNREEDPDVLKEADVIMTTYSVLESVYRKQTTGFKRKDGIYKQDSPLHVLKFHRVILDEAHNIKDRSSKSARAAFALQTEYKLCLSGTPLQNRIGELFSLLRFLEADPFSYYYCRNCPCKSLNWKFKANRGCDDCGHSPMHHLCLFNHELLKPIQNNGNEGPGKVAFQKLQILLKHLMLRRTKEERADDLGLPPKVVKVRRDYFNEEELDVYDSIYGDSKRKFNTYVAHGVVLNNYANIFTLITRMRQLADHPDLVLKKEALNGQNTLVCVLCDDEAEDAIKSKCHHTFCRLCVQEYIGGFDGDSNPDCPKCHITLNIDLTAPAIEIDEDTVVKKNSIINRIDMSQWHSSTKIEALVEELYKLRSKNHTIKSIVFSQFTSMLQLVEWRLRKAGFQTAMLEGSMTPTQRNATIQHFMENIETTVFLVSLKAGGVALNLIEASQVFIMDPWWNPSVEWQAADRIHRIGQTRACKVTRLVIEDSIESRILDLQEKKARMIHATVGADQGAMDKLTPADMQFLFQN